MKIITITNRKELMVWVVYQWPIRVRKEGSVGTIIYFRIPHLFLKKERESVGRNDTKILEHQFGRDDGGGSSFWSRYSEMES